MNILSTAQIREADAYTIANEPIASVDLMERASAAFADWFSERFPAITHVNIFAGIGNNGGDGLAIARLLAGKGIAVDAFIVRYSDQTSPDFRTNEIRLKQLAQVAVTDLKAMDEFPACFSSNVFIDALWGSGINRPIEGLGKEVILRLNAQHGLKLSVDVPSGLAGEHWNDSVTFEAAHTFSFERPKLSFFLPQNHRYVGEWHVRPIGLMPEFLEVQQSKWHYLTREEACALIRPRAKYSHKGSNGHSLVVAGSYGKIGAGILAGKACLVTGSGLVTYHLPHCGVNPVHAACPELMLSIDQHEYHVTNIPEAHRYDAIGIGPGLDTHQGTKRALYDLLRNCEQPVVMDADGLNILARQPDWLGLLPRNSILTPHPKEFERLFGPTEDDYQRLELQLERSKQFALFIVLKGAHTTITTPDGNAWFNCTGNPALATAGSGDVLTGMITGFLAQGYEAKESALLGVYVHGLAADLYAGQHRIDRMIASDVIRFIPSAFATLTTATYD